MKDPKLLTTGEVAAKFGVSVKTVRRWASIGKVRKITTPGGHLRYPESDVRALLEGQTPEETP